MGIINNSRVHCTITHARHRKHTRLHSLLVPPLPLITPSAQSAKTASQHTPQPQERAEAVSLVSDSPQEAPVQKATKDMANSTEMIILGGNSHPELLELVAAHLDKKPCAVTACKFMNGGSLPCPCRLCHSRVLLCL